MANRNRYRAGLSLTVPSTDRPVSLASAKLHLRVGDGEEEDFLIRALIAAATEYVENFTGRALISQTWIEYFDAFPACISLKKSPAVSVTSIKYLDSAGDEQTLPAADYTVDVITEKSRIAPVYGSSWPSTYGEFNSVYVEYVAGYGDTEDDVPHSIRAALLLLIGHLYENREVSIPTALNELPFGFDALLTPYRLWWM